MYEVPRVALIKAVEEGKQIAAEIIQLQLMLANDYLTKDYVAELYESLLRRVDAIQGRAELAQQKVREMGPPSLGPMPDAAMRGMAELRVLAAELREGKEPKKVQDEMVRVSGTLVGPAMTQWFESGVGKYNMINDAEASGRTLCTQVVRFAALGPGDEGVNAAGVDMPKLDKVPTPQAHPYLRSTPRQTPPTPNRYSPRSPSGPYQPSSPGRDDPLRTPPGGYVPVSPGRAAELVAATGSHDPEADDFEYQPPEPTPSPRFEPRSPSLPPAEPTPRFEPRSPSLPPAEPEGPRFEPTSPGEPLQPVSE